MKKQFLILITFVLLAIPMSSFGQKAVRVKFAKGATTAIATGNLQSYKSKAVVFVIRVKMGQTLSVEQLIPDNSNHYVTFGITNPSGEDVTDAEANCNNNKTIENTAAGDYRIEVTECTKADAWSGSFKIKFTVK
jgi:transglutaminase/protease-like cytokinesis protein 3